MKKALRIGRGVIKALLGVCLAVSIVLVGIHIMEWIRGTDLKPPLMVYVVFIGILVGCYLAIYWSVGGRKR